MTETIGLLKRMTDDCFEMIDQCTAVTVRHQDWSRWHFQQLVSLHQKIAENIRRLKGEFDAESTQAVADNKDQDANGDGSSVVEGSPKPQSDGGGETVVDSEPKRATGERDDPWAV